MSQHLDPRAEQDRGTGRLYQRVGHLGIHDRDARHIQQNRVRSLRGDGFVKCEIKLDTIGGHSRIQLRCGVSFLGHRDLKPGAEELVK
jgi:hypothetical protein